MPVQFGHFFGSGLFVQLLNGVLMGVPCFLAWAVIVRMRVFVGMGVPVAMGMDGSIFMPVFVSVIVNVRVSVFGGHGIVLLLDGSRNAPPAHIR